MTAAIQHLYDRLKAHYPHAQLELGGIYANKPGYHNKRDNLPAHDYSVQQPDDQAGSGQNASALDITLRDPADMAKLTQRLIDLTYAADPRIQVLREFLGTLDGVNVVGCDVRGMYDITSEDTTHTWHEHISIFRRWAGDWAAMDAVADAIIGGTSPGDEDDMTPEQEQQLAQAANDASEARRMLGVLLGWNNPADPREQQAWAMAGNAAESRRMLGVQLRWDNPAADTPEEGVIAAQDRLVEQVQEIKDAVT